MRCNQFLSQKYVSSTMEAYKTIVAALLIVCGAFLHFITRKYRDPRN